MQMMTLRGASEHLGISKNRIWRAVKDGHLVAEEGKFKGQTALMVSQADLEAWAQEWMSPEELEVLKRLEAPDNHREAPREHLEVPDKRLEVPQEYLKVLEGIYEVPHGVHEVFEGVYEMPQGTSKRSQCVLDSESTLREDLVGALERSHQELRLVERRANELEFQLRQHQLLLTENSESLLEREALLKQATAKLEATEAESQTEVQRLALELAAAQAKEALAQEAKARIENAEIAKTMELERLSAELESTRRQLMEAQKPKGLFSWLSLRKNRTASGQVDKAV